MIIVMSLMIGGLVVLCCFLGDVTIKHNMLTQKHRNTTLKMKALHEKYINLQDVIDNVTSENQLYIKTYRKLNNQIYNMNILYSQLYSKYSKLSAEMKNRTAQNKELWKYINIRSNSRNGTRVKDCLDLYDNGYSIDGLYVIQPRDNVFVAVYCDQSTDGGGWTVFQRRMKDGVSFDQSWEDYKHGFGDILSDFWLGNKYLNLMTKSRSQELRVDLEDWDGNTVYASYSTFIISDETSKFRLNIGGYSGNAGDSAMVLNGMRFSTMDRDHDNDTRNCAELYHGGWWYSRCFRAKLNGDYFPTHAPPIESRCAGIHWHSFHDSCLYSLKRAEMKLRRKNLKRREYIREIDDIF